MFSRSDNPAARSGGVPTLQLAVPPPDDDAAPVLVACSVCLCVLGGSGWTDAETVIRELRSYDLASPPRLSPALCDRCDRSLRERRTRQTEAIAA